MTNVSRSDTISEMIEALEANIEYLKNNGSSQIHVYNGRLVNVAGDYSVYQFLVDRTQDLDTDMEIELRIGRESSAGTVVSIIDNQVQVSIDTHHGDAIHAAVLIVSSYYLLEKLCQYLQSKKDDTENTSILADKVVGLMPIVSALDLDYDTRSVGRLNASQEQAVRRSLGSDVTFIWGPPGTGKSDTISVLIEELNKRGLSVLLISHTNKATDGVLKSVVERLKSSDDYRDGKFLRFGSLKTIADDIKGYKVIPEVILEEKAKPLKLELEALSEKIFTIMQSVDECLEYEKKQQELAKIQSDVSKTQDYIESKISHSKEVKAEVLELRNLVSMAEKTIEKFQGKGRLARAFSGTSLARLMGARSSYTSKQVAREGQIATIKQEIAVARSRNDLTDRRVLELEQWLSYRPQLSGINIKGEKKKLEDLSAQKQLIQQKIDELGDDLIKDAKLIATTLTKAYVAKPLLERRYDCVILDEASMAPIPSVYAAVGRGTQKAIIVGDFFQLPPIVKHRVDKKNKTIPEIHREEMLVKKWLEEDIFEHIGIAKDIRSGTKPAEYLTQLNTQYRMHPGIAQLVNKLVYSRYNDEYQLISDEKTETYGSERLGSEPIPGMHFGLVDTASLGAMAAKSDPGSWYNLPNALVCIELAKKALESGYSNVGIISAYRAQVNLIQKMVEEKLPGTVTSLTVNTVHKFQGDQKQVIIFDVTTPISGSMYDDYKDGGDDEKLINVAFSRAEEKLVVVGDLKAIEKQHSKTSLIRKSVEHSRELGNEEVSAKDLLSEFELKTSEDQWLAVMNSVDVTREFQNSELFDETDFYPNFTRDLLSAEKEVIIQSPFIGYYRAEKLRPTLSALVRRGVKLILITRDPAEHGKAMSAIARKELTEYEALGAIILPFKYLIHQKFAIIDRRIIWEGSLNILSQNNSGEVMRRYEGSGSVGQYMAFQKLDKNLGEIGTIRLKRCEICEGPGSWFWTKKVAGNNWQFCLVGNHSLGKAPATAEEKRAKDHVKLEKKGKAAEARKSITFDATGNPICGEHHTPLEPAVGRFGPYWACPKAKECFCIANDSQLKRLRA